MIAFTLPIPTYQCHKRVQALRIKAIIANPRGYELHFEDERFCPHQVDLFWVNQHGAEVGGYFVVYADGYTSYSPAAAFEAGYTPLSDGDFTPEQVSAAEETARAWSAFQYEWPGGPSEVDAALASRDAEIERLRNALYLAQGIAQRVIAETAFDESQVADWRPVVRDALRPVGPATQAAREVAK